MRSIMWLLVPLLFLPAGASASDVIAPGEAIDVVAGLVEDVEEYTRSSPEAIRRKDDFPAPLGPRRPVIPGGMSTVTSFSPITSPYHRERLRQVMIGVLTKPPPRHRPDARG